MELNRYIKHPELLNRDTLYYLRGYVALYPYHQAARLLLLQNLYLLHDPTLSDELTQAALFVNDRTVLFNLLDAKRFQLKKKPVKHQGIQQDRKEAIIDNYINSVPQEPAPEPKKEKRAPTVADATIDYTTYLLEAYGVEDEEPATEAAQHANNIIDNFLENEGGKIVLPETHTYTPQPDVELENDKDTVDEGYFTEALAKIYIKQGDYSKALEIIQRLNLLFPKKSAYFADQIRFLEKIILIKQ